MLQIPITRVNYEKILDLQVICFVISTVFFLIVFIYSNYLLSWCLYKYSLIKNKGLLVINRMKLFEQQL